MEIAEEFQRLIATDIDKWGRVIREAKIKTDEPGCLDSPGRGAHDESKRYAVGGEYDPVAGRRRRRNHPKPLRQEYLGCLASLESALRRQAHATEGARGQTRNLSG